jgi:hypothetical protein
MGLSSNSQILRSRGLVLVLLVLSSFNCVRDIFFVNITPVNLALYERGSEFNPFQSRALMVPAMKWAAEQPRLQSLAAHFNDLAPAREKYTPEKLLAMVVGFVCVLGMGIMITIYAPAFGIRTWWLPWTLVLLTLYITYAARSTQAFWYPWDLPQFLLFGAAAICILRSWLPGFILLFPLLSVNRETSIFLIFLWGVVHVGKVRWPRLLLQMALPTVIYAACRYFLFRLYGHNPSIAYPHTLSNFNVIVEPRHWPQLFSAFAYLLPILWLYRKRLDAVNQRFLLGMLPCLAAILAFGIWTETRIFDEFTVPFALMAAQAWDRVHEPKTLGSASAPSA